MYIGQVHRNKVMGGKVTLSIYAYTKYTCTYMYIYKNIHVYTCICIYSLQKACMYVCMYVCMYSHGPVRIHSFRFCIYVCMYTHMYVHVLLGVL